MTSPPGIRAALQFAEQQLTDTSSSPRLDAEVLLAHVLQKSRTHLHAWPERLLTKEQWACFLALLGKRAQGVPIAYLTGRREFWSLPLEVNEDTLIPRPETELLVEIVLELLPRTPCRVADLGTGSGAIALALASERPGWSLVASDRSTAALTLARANAQRLELSNIEFTEGDWCSSLAGHFQLIAANPPYIAPDDPHLDCGDVRFEPVTALAAADAGLADLTAIAGCAPAHLENGGWLVLEHGFEQGDAVRKLLTQQGFVEIATRRDAAGHERTSFGRKP